MADTDEEIDVVLEDAPEGDVAGADGVADTPAPDKTADAVQPQDGIDALKAKLDEEKRAREAERAARLAAERRAGEAADAEHKARLDQHDTNLALVNSAIGQAEAAQAQLKAQFKEAMAAGDFDTAADVQAQLGEKGAELVALRSGKQALEKAPKPEKKAESQPIVDPVEQIAQHLSPKSAAWLRSHPEYAQSQRKFDAMLGAHNIAVDRGLEADTPEYFAAVERVLGIGHSDDAPARRESQAAEGADEAMSGASQGSGRRASAPAAAPPSRGGDTSGGSRAQTVRLTAAQREMAAAMQMTDQEYARHLVALKSEGKIH